MRARSDDLRQELRAVAAPQHGYFTAAQAMMAGYAYASQRYHTDQGEWIKIDRRIYRLAEWIERHPDDDLIRWSLWGNGRAVISHTTAMWVHDLGSFLQLPVHLTVGREFTRDTDGAVLHHIKQFKAEIDDRGVYRVTNPMRSILDTATLEQVAPQSLHTAIDQAVARNLVTVDELRSRAGELGSEFTEPLLAALSTRT
jgi:hypothetical protein